ncbi:MAG: S-methyl-5'-thioadenosine phosphorylase [Proteobacteria bacterium]|nr:S-methyl-5'-thioadenosine phosphorylase [Pseudomonadota bacterium]
MVAAVLGIIGGSGLYDLPGLQDVRTLSIHSPWGDASDSPRSGSLNGREVVFLPRHGRGHLLSPSDINYRANIDVLKRAGVTDLVSVSACGSFRDDLPPGTFVLVDQFVDRTVSRTSSFFGRGCVAHVSMAHPVGPALQDRIVAASEVSGVPVVRGGTYVCIEGPQFSSKAESVNYKALGHDVIGMTAMPEAKLAREAEITYATIAMVTDFDCWHPDHDHVTVADVVKVAGENVARVRNLICALVRDFPLHRMVCPVGSHRALDGAIMTAPSARDPEVLSRLDAVAGRVLLTDQKG